MGGGGGGCKGRLANLFFTQHPLDTWGGFAGGHFKNQLKIDF